MVRNLSDSMAKGMLILGILETVAAVIAVICGIVAITKITSPGGVTVGLWALYFAVPIVFCFLAYHQKTQGMMAGALAANIIGCILAVIATIVAGVFWAAINTVCGKSWQRLLTDDICVCYYDYKSYIYHTSCDDLRDTVRNAVALCTIMYIVLSIVSFIASIYGCVATCCASGQPGVVIAASAPPQTTIVTSQTNQASTAGYIAQPYPPAYTAQPVYPGGAQPAAYPAAPVQYPVQSGPQPAASPDFQQHAYPPAGEAKVGLN